MKTLIVSLAVLLASAKGQGPKQGAKVKQQEESRIATIKKAFAARDSAIAASEAYDQTCSTRQKMPFKVRLALNAFSAAYDAFLNTDHVTDAQKDEIAKKCGSYPNPKSKEGQVYLRCAMLLTVAEKDAKAMIVASQNLIQAISGGCD